MIKLHIKKRIYMHWKKKYKKNSGHDLIVWEKSNKSSIRLIIEYSLAAYVEFPRRDVHISTPPIMLNSMCIFSLITHSWGYSSL